MSYPGMPTVMSVNEERAIAQVGEYPEDRDLLEPALRSGVVLLKEDRSKARETTIRSFAEIRELVARCSRSVISPETARKIEKQKKKVFAKSSQP